MRRLRSGAGARALSLRSRLRWRSDDPGWRASRRRGSMPDASLIEQLKQDRGLAWQTWPFKSDVMEAAGPYDRAKALSAFKLGDVTFYWITRACAISVLLILGGIILSLIVGAWPAMKEYGFSFLFTSALGAFGRSAGARRARSDLRHAGHLRHRDADRHSGRPRHRDLPDRALPAVAAPPDRHRRSSCSPASPRSSTACGASSCSARSWPIPSSRS